MKIYRPWACERLFLLFDCSGTSYCTFGGLQLDISYSRCPVEREFLAGLSILVVLPQNINDLSNLVNDCTVLDRPYDVCPIVSELGDCGRDCDIERQLPAVRRLMLEDCADDQMLRLSCLVTTRVMRFSISRSLATNAVSSQMFCSLPSRQISFSISSPRRTIFKPSGNYCLRVYCTHSRLFLGNLPNGRYFRWRADARTRDRVLAVVSFLGIVL